MFEILESVFEGPIRLIPLDDLKFKTGDIIEFIETDGIPKIKLSDGTQPFGIVGKIDGDNKYGLIPVWYDTMIIKTNIYEKDEYELGDSLYVSLNGKLTNKKMRENSYLMGYVSKVETNNIEVNWI